MSAHVLRLSASEAYCNYYSLFESSQKDFDVERFHLRMTAFSLQYLQMCAKVQRQEAEVGSVLRNWSER